MASTASSAWASGSTSATPSWRSWRWTTAAWLGASTRTPTPPCSSRCHPVGCVSQRGSERHAALVTPPTLQDFYQEVANPLLTAVAFEYPGNIVEEVTQDNFGLLFKGSEMVVAGKLRDQSPDVLSAKVRGQLVSVAGHPGEEGQLEWAFEGPGPNPSPTRLQLMGQEQSTTCPLPPGDDIGLHRMGSWWTCSAMMAGLFCPGGCSVVLLC